MTSYRKGCSSSLRKGRFSERNRIYLITTTTHHRRRLFEDLYLGRLVVKCLAREIQASTLCYVVMPDHLHWMVQLHGDDELSRVVGRIKSRSARMIAQRLRSGGSVWQEGFHDHAVRWEEDVRTMARYVVENPIRAGIVGSAGLYPLWDAIWL